MMTITVTFVQRQSSCVAVMFPSALLLSFLSGLEEELMVTNTLWACNDLAKYYSNIQHLKSWPLQHTKYYCSLFDEGWLTHDTHLVRAALPGSHKTLARRSRVATKPVPATVAG